MPGPVPGAGKTACAATVARWRVATTSSGCVSGVGTGVGRGVVAGAEDRRPQPPSKRMRILREEGLAREAGLDVRVEVAGAESIVAEWILVVLEVVEAMFGPEQLVGF